MNKCASAHDGVMKQKMQEHCLGKPSGTRSRCGTENQPSNLLMDARLESSFTNNHANTSLVEQIWPSRRRRRDRANNRPNNKDSTSTSPNVTRSKPRHAPNQVTPAKLTNRNLKQRQRPMRVRHIGNPSIATRFGPDLAGGSNTSSPLLHPQTQSSHRAQQHKHRKTVKLNKGALLLSTILPPSTPDSARPDWRFYQASYNRKTVIYDALPGTTHSGHPLLVTLPCLSRESCNNTNHALNHYFNSAKLKSIDSRNTNIATACIWQKPYCATHADGPQQSAEYARSQSLQDLVTTIDNQTTRQICAVLDYHLPYVLQQFLSIQVPKDARRPVAFAPGLFANKDACTKWYKDSGDDPESYCIIAAFGDHTGGGLRVRAPVTVNGIKYDGVVLPSGKGMITVMRSALLLHSNEAYQGSRHSVVWATDFGLSKWSDSQLY